RQLPRPGGRQRLLVRAEFSDGTSQDVTHQAVFSSNDTSVVAVDPGGRATGASPGETVVFARYLGRIGSGRVMVLPAVRPAVRDYANFHPVNFIDELALARWRQVGVAPSDPCTDAEFLRRVSLDLTATLPTP